MKIKTEPGEIWTEYNRGLRFNQTDGFDLAKTARENQMFMIGRQWEGLDTPDLDKPVFNMARRVVTFFIASIVSDNIGVNVTEFFGKAENKAVMDMLSREFAAVMEQCRFSAKSREALYNAAVDGDACLHYWFDPGAQSETSENHPGPSGHPSVGGELIGTPGVIKADVLDNTNVFFGDPQCAEVEEQPYIIIQFRRFAEDVQALALEHAAGADEIEADENISAVKTDGEAPGKVTVLRKYYKEDGRVWFCEVTSSAVVRPPTNTGYRLYPLAWMPWEKVKNRYHGQAALTGIIPNQRFLNKLYAMAMEHVTRMAFPKVIYDRVKFPDGWSNRAGGAVGVEGDPNTAVASNFRPADMSSQVLEMVSRVMMDTRDTMGGSDAALGNIKPENTSAIIATQKATSMPLELPKMAYYQFVEDGVRIWLEMMTENYGMRKVEWNAAGEDGTQALDWVNFDFSALRGMNLKLNVDIGASTYWSELMQVQTLDNIFTSGVLDDPERAELYLELMPAQYIQDKHLILDYVRKKKAALEAAGQAQPGMPPQSGIPQGIPQAAGLPPEMMAMMAGGAL